MAKKVISYKLTEAGTIPLYVEDGGYLPKNSNDTVNMVLIGISVDEPTLPENVVVYETEADLVAYLDSYLEGTVYINPQTHEEVPFDSASEASKVFAKLA